MASFASLRMTIQCFAQDGTARDPRHPSPATPAGASSGQATYLESTHIPEVPPCHPESFH